MDVVESLLPIFLLIGLGAALTAGGFLTREMLQHLNRVAYWIGLPALIFASVAGAQIATERSLKISLVVIVATVAGLLAAWLLARFVKLPNAAVGTLMQASFRGNLAFIALPLTIYVFNRPGAPPGSVDMAPTVALAIAPVMILYNVLGVGVLVASHHRLTRESLLLFVRQVLTNPLVLALVAGLLFSRSDWTLPRFVSTTISTIGGLAIPAALLGVGGTLMAASLRSRLLVILGGALVKIGVVPVAGWLVANWFGLPAPDAAVATMLCATPTAAAAFIMTTQLRGDVDLASGIIAVSTIGSAISLGLAVAQIH